MQISWVHDPTTWNKQLASLPAAHILQTWEWGEFKAQTTGWTPRRCLYLGEDDRVLAAASILTRRVGPFRMIYVPKGPVFADTSPAYIESVLDHLQKLARGAVWLKIDPDIVIATGFPPEASNDQPYQPNPAGEATQHLLQSRKWRFSRDQVQFRNTLVLDLTQSEDKLLADMSQSTRRKIRLADKREVVVRATHNETDWRTLYDLYATTGQRQDFAIRPWDYYCRLWSTFHAAGLARILVAEYQEQILAGIVLFHFGERVWYFYGMSSGEHRDRQPNYALQWAAIRWAKTEGYKIYDWWGAPNVFTEDDPMWGVYRFKRGFGSQIVRTMGAWDYTPYPALYWLYAQAAPRFVNWLRRRGSNQE